MTSFHVSQSNIVLYNTVLYIITFYTKFTLSLTHSIRSLMSTIITNVLAYHLGWVPTVAPVLGTDDRVRRNVI